MSRKSLPVLAAAAAMLLVADAHAGSAGPVSFTARAQVNGNCTVTVSGQLDFTTYDPVAANASSPQPGSGASLSIKCTRGSHPIVAMDNGANLGNANNPIPGKRAMATGGGLANEVLAYDILQPTGLGAGGTASAVLWGTAAGSSFDAGVWTVSPTTAQVVNIFGSIPGGQDVTAGLYTDTVNATVNF
jgi:spore coat protein U-like protein